MKKIFCHQIEVSFEVMSFQLAYEWKLSRNTSKVKQNILFKICFEGKEIILSEAAPNIRYGESIEMFSIETGNFIKKFNDISKNVLLTPDLIKEMVLEIPEHFNSLKFALHSGFESLFAHLEGKTLNDYYQIPSPKAVQMMYSIPIMEIEDLEKFYLEHYLIQYEVLKLKVNKDNAVPFTNELLRIYPNSIIIDANESFINAEEVVLFLENINKERILFLEQPIHESNRTEIENLHKICDFPIFADESVQLNPDWKFISENFEGINVKLMKAGSFSNGLFQIQKARELGLKTMIGCMIESTVGINYAYKLAKLVDYVDLDGFLVIKEEPFHLLTIQDGMLINLEKC